MYEFCHSNKIHLYSVKIYLCLKKFYVQTDFFSHKKYIHIQSKKMCSMKYFYSLSFGSQIWSSICQRNSLKLLHVLYSDTRVNHKTNSHLTVLPLKFVSCLRGAKYTSSSGGFLLDLIIPLHRGNLSFFQLLEK